MEKVKNKYGLGWIFSKTKGTRLYLALYTLLVIVSTVATLSIAFVLKMFMDVATGDINNSIGSIALLAAGIVVVIGITEMAKAVLTQYIYGKTERNLRTELINVIFSRRMADISKQHTGELLTKLTVDVQAVSNCFVTIIDKMVGGLSSAVLATASLFFLNWKMALIMLVLTPLLMLVMGIFTPHMKKASEADKKNDEANRSLMQEDLSRIMLIKAYFMQNKVIAKIQNAYAKKLKSGIKLGIWEGLISFSGNVVSFAMFLVALGVGAYFVMKGETTIGSLIAIIQLLNYIVNPVANFAGAISGISQATASSSRIGDLYSLPADDDVTAADPVDAIALAAENMSFSYGGTEENTGDGGNMLEDINISFKKGLITGLVGKSGSGKSTILKLLIGLYSPKNGNIELKYNQGALNGVGIMPQIAYVPPNDYLFSGTVAENIAMSDDKPSLTVMKKASSDANILDFIESLPDGFDTLIGESGGTVSSGQAQRIAIARAIYKKSPVIVFDEPTANLDAESIEKFQTAIKTLAKDKICIIVTHDSSTMSVCDKVYVLENGRVRESLSGEDLEMDA